MPSSSLTIRRKLISSERCSSMVTQIRVLFRMFGSSCISISPATLPFCPRAGLNVRLRGEPPGAESISHRYFCTAQSTLLNQDDLVKTSAVIGPEAPTNKFRAHTTVSPARMFRRRHVVEHTFMHKMLSAQRYKTVFHPAAWKARVVSLICHGNQAFQLLESPHLQEE
jgi:hypothetical protein